MAPHTNPYYLAGPFGAAPALLATASARTSGRSPRPEARASLIADLMAAGLSASGAFKVQEFAEQLDPFPWTASPDQSILTVLDDLLRRTHTVLASELQTDQVHAFTFGAAMCLAHSITVTRWDAPSEGHTRLLAELTRAQSAAHTLGVGEPEVGALLSAAQAPWSLPSLLAPGILRATGVILNALLRR